MPISVLVVGASGTQGSAIIRALTTLNKSRSNNPITIHALIRSTSSPPQSLNTDSNVKLFTGDFDDISSLKAAATGCTAAFLNVTPVFTDLTAEARHARNLVEACASIASLKRFVFSPGAVLHRPADDIVWSEYIDKSPQKWMSIYTKSKQACETAVTSSSTTNFEEGWCMVRATAFLTNFLPPVSKFMYPDLETKGIISAALREDLQISYLDPEDLGPLVARQLICDKEEWETRWKGNFVPVAKENLTLGQSVEKMNAVLGRHGVKERVEVVWIGEEEARTKG
ncbi:hypothetical protein LTR05_000459 [Lithohypha guttulata]|uniref:NmrA-like domain-containing protein n=1 Tax=Lithohypha guttulata TaxID=1690604 RepID=A0AAN7YDW2_9EURO|nr:hypothetical protein LTR05_000459 [Lithohypha guttulata]